jgi:DNA-binding transcriptional regulator WhiA
MGAREKMDIPVYEGNLDVEELLDWIRALDTYFDYEDVEEDKKVKHVVTRLKDMQHCGGMNYKLTDAAKASRKSRVGIG